MRVTVNLFDRGEITIKSENDFSNDELIDLAQRATRWLKSVKPQKERGHFGFGPEEQ